MTYWVRFAYGDSLGFGVLDSDRIIVHEGDMFTGSQPTSRTLARDDVRLLMPSTPSKMIALWNNFRALGEKLGVPPPKEPLYLLKAGSSFQDPDTAIKRPKSYSGKVAYEGELGIVIGRMCKDISEDEADACIFGYTCVNDITAADILNRDSSFPQWVRAKSFDGFGPFGPAIATHVRPSELIIRTILNGEERQNYPVADMIFSAQRLTSLISHDMTLFPGDVICCGTSLGVASMKEKVNDVEVAIEGIGNLRNRFINEGSAEGLQ